MKLTKEEYKQEYLRYFTPQPPRQLTQDEERRYRVRFVSSQEFERRSYKSDVRLAYVGNQAHIAVYIVDLGRFRFTVKLLNLPGKAPRAISKGSGGFGCIVQKSVSGLSFVAKVIELFGKTTLEEVVMELAISKLCAIYQIGPDVQTRIPFDIILYEDAAQFHLQQCAPARQLNNEKMKVCKRDIRCCIEVLHSLHIAHRDIKPSNCLWREGLGKYVLCDFGVAEYIQEDFGFVSTTCCAGTNKYMGTEMRLLDEQKAAKGEVDLFYNDYWAWNMFPGQFFESYSEEIRGTRHKGQPVSNQAITFTEALEFPDMYGFYRLLHATTDLYEHEFSFTENMMQVKDKRRHQDFILERLKRSLNRGKLEQAVRELRERSSQHSQEQTGDAENWISDLKTREADLDDYKPQPMELQSPQSVHLANLMRLVDKERRTALKKVKERVQDKTISDEEYVGLAVSHVVWKCNERIAREIDKIIFLFRRSSTKIAVTESELYHVCQHILVAPMSYDNRLHLIRQARKQLQSNSPDPFLLKAAIVYRHQFQLQDFVSYIKEESSLEKCYFIAQSALEVAEFHCDEAEQAVSHLIDRLKQKPAECYYLETMASEYSLLCIQAAQLKIDYRQVQSYIARCEQSMKYASHEDGNTLCWLLKLRIHLLDMFVFPDRVVEKAHLEFERYRQYYEEMSLESADPFVTFYYGYPQNNTSDQATPQLHPKEQRISKLKKIQQQAAAYLSGFDPSDKLMSYIQQAEILFLAGETNQAEALLLNTVTGMLEYASLDERLSYHLIRGKIDMRLGSFAESVAHLEQSIHINSKLYPTDTQVYNDSSMRMLVAVAHGLMNNHLKALQMLNEVEKRLDESDELLSELYERKARMLYEANQLESCVEYLNKIFSLEHKQLVSAQQAAIAHSLMVAVARKLNCTEEQMVHAWTYFEKTPQINSALSYEVYESIVRLYRPIAGDEVFSFLRYVHRNLKPLQKVFGDNIKLSTVPEGKLQLSMSTGQFLNSAESQLRELPKKLHAGTVIFKRRLVRVMRLQSNQHPSFRLLSIRTRVEICLHLFLAGSIRKLCSLFPGIICEMQEVSVVSPKDQQRKTRLIDYCRSLFVRAQQQSRAKQIDRALTDAWTDIEKASFTSLNQCRAYIILIEAYRPRIGNEVFSLLRSVRQSKCELPDEFFSNGLIDKVFAQNPIPPGQLPFDLSIRSFIEEAEPRIRELPRKSDLACYLFKRRLLRVIESHTQARPEFKLLYVRMLVEIVLHRFVGRDFAGVAKQLPDVIRDMTERRVEPSDEPDKALLIGFARTLLKRTSAEFPNRSG